MTKGIELKPKDIKELEGVINSITKILKKHPDLDNKLGLSDKFLGPLGEATGLVKIMKGKTAVCLWHGKFKEDFDLVVTENREPINYQIKSSSNQDHFLFRVLEVQFERNELPEVMKQLRNNDPSPLLAGIDKAVDDQKSDYWLLVYIKKDETEFFKLDRETMKSVAKQSYKNYYHNTPHRKSTNYGVSQTSGNCIVMFSGKLLGDPELLEPYKI
jgi:hypothetical protein